MDSFANIKPDWLPEIALEGAPPMTPSFSLAYAEALQDIEKETHLYNGRIILARAWHEKGKRVVCFEADYAWSKACKAVWGEPEDCASAVVLGVHALVRDSKGYWLWSLRGAHVEAPGHIGPSVSGYIDAGDSWQSALEREMREELGLLPPDIANIRALGSYTFRWPQSNKIQAAGACYLVDLKPDVQVNLNDEVENMFYCRSWPSREYPWLALLKEIGSLAGV